MNKKGIHQYLIILIVVGIIVIGFALLVKANNSGGIGSSGKPKVVCDVNLINRPLQDTKIDTSSCTVVGKCGLFSFDAQLGVFSDKGTITMSMGDKEDKQTYKADESLSPETEVRLSLCTDATSGNIILFNDNGQILERRSFNV